ncbi:hypothetical protein H3C66_00230 [Patescibacteria group bacterium]|nr:hypothetical protein [Patescibacteria group bacterium]
MSISLRSHSWFFSAVYAVLRITAGMIVHPYQTLQSVVQEKIFLWLTVLPSGILFLLMLSWRWWILPNLEVWFDCYPYYPLICRSINILATWISFFCLYWQILVGYLTIRFLLAFRK